jgi:PAS domain S-box-containing protein
VELFGWLCVSGRGGVHTGAWVGHTVVDNPEARPAAGGTRAATRSHEATPAMDVSEDEDFDRLSRLAAKVCGAATSLIGGVEGGQAWLKSRVNLGLASGRSDESLYAGVLAGAGANPLMVQDASREPAFRDQELVVNRGIRFIAGAPIFMHGAHVGALCVLDRKPREADDPDVLGQLEDLAAIAGTLFERKEEARVRARTSAQLIREEWRHALTLEAGKVGSWVWDIRTREVAVNDILRRMFHLDPLSLVDIDDILGFIHPEDRPSVDAALETTFRSGADYFSEFRVNSGRWLIGRGRVYQRDAAGNPQVMMGVNIDVTDAKEAADHTRFLLRELNHRVKNTLAMIQSLARQTLRQTPEPQRFLDAFSGRLRTVSDAHALLSERDWSGIGLVELVTSQVFPFVPTTPEQLVIEGEDVELPPDHAIGLGLILHELSSNASRHGALSIPDGQVMISWRAVSDGAPRLHLLWQEKNGPEVVPPRELGFGSRLIQRSLDKILESQVTLEFPPAGVKARVALPLPA